MFGVFARSGAFPTVTAANVEEVAPFAVTCGTRGHPAATRAVQNALQFPAPVPLPGRSYVVFDPVTGGFYQVCWDAGIRNRNSDPVFPVIRRFGYYFFAASFPAGAVVPLDTVG